MTVGETKPTGLVKSREGAEVLGGLSSLRRCRIELESFVIKLFSYFQKTEDSFFSSILRTLLVLLST